MLMSGSWGIDGGDYGPQYINRGLEILESVNYLPSPGIALIGELLRGECTIVSPVAFLAEYFSQQHVRPSARTILRTSIGQGHRAERLRHM